MSAAPHVLEAGAERVSLRIDEPDAAKEVTAILTRRGVRVADGPADGDAVIALSTSEPISLETASTLAESCMEGARRRRPTIILAAWGADQLATPERAATLGYLRSFGAIICHDPSTWIETIVLVSRFGLPLGPRLAVVAQPGSLIAAQAIALERESSQRRATFRGSLDGADEGHDAVLVDASTMTGAIPTHVGGARVLPVVARGELASSARPELVDLRHAMAAVAAAGDLALRLDAGLGPGPDQPPESVAIERERFERQLRNVSTSVGDHETKVLLSAYGISVSRQAVATTPSGAVRIAKKAGYPVDIKPWGPEVASEAEDCPVERDLLTAADVRRAFGAVATAAGLPSGAPVIVRAAPPEGREVRVSLVDLAEIGWTVVVQTRSRPEPAAAPAPLSRHDADALAAAVMATRADDPEPDLESLVDLLISASYMVWEQAESFRAIHMGRIRLPHDGGAIVVDASAQRRRGS